MRPSRPAATFIRNLISSSPVAAANPLAAAADPVPTADLAAAADSAPASSMPTPLSPNSSPPRQTFDVVHPGTGALAHQVERSSPGSLARAVGAAAAGLPRWRATPLAERKAVFARAAALLEDERSGWTDRLVAANRKEVAVSHWWSATQIHMAAGALRALVDVADTALAEQTIQGDHATFTITREPYGVCLAIAAWNAVHVLTARAIATPLLAGNTVVLKTSETAPHSQALWAELLFAAGLPHSALSVVHVAGGDAAHLVPLLVSDPRVRHVNFTGSTRVGSILASAAGKHLKPTLMELGGKAPVLLLPDADLATAASHIVFGAFMNAGQVCMSTERVLVPASQYGALVAALEAAWDTVEAKVPRALFQRSAATRVRALIADTVAAGASPVLPYPPATGDGNASAFVSPTLLGGVTPAMRLYAEESFGPVAAIMSVPDDAGADALIDEMVRIANDTEYGLSAAVWGRDTARAAAVARRIDAGAVHVNAPTPADPPAVPHGGWKSSGWGRFNGAEGLRSFTQTRSIEVVRDPQPMPLNVFEL